jgi:DNA replication protein DnaC
MSTPADAELRDRARRLGLWGLLANWDTLSRQPWVREYLGVEEDERGRRSLERRIRGAKLGAFKSIADFDWRWPKTIDRDQVEDLLHLGFLDERANVVLFGPTGVGKTMIAQNLGYQALQHGHTALMTTASAMLNDLAAQDSAAGLARRLRRYCRPRLLVLDEIGYFVHAGRAADLFFEVISQRYGEKSTVMTSNKPFSEWPAVFGGAGCVSAIVDRVVHKVEIVKVDGESYRQKEAMERAEQKAKERKARSKQRRSP